MRTTLVLLTSALTLVGACSSSKSTDAGEPEETPNVYARWSHGPDSGADYFPIAVWLQDPSNVARYQAAGINLYVGLWQGPTEQQLANLSAAGMQVVCDQNAVGLAHLEDPTIVAWMHGDEPDNAQALASGGGYGPPILPEVITADYQEIAARDPSRPVLLNLGQGVAYDEYVGRGVRTNHPEDYLEYVQGADIVSFDIYPAASDRPAVDGNLWYVAQGVERLRRWTQPQQVVWNCIECTRIHTVDHKATPHQVKAEVWMSLIHGSTGLIYFVHEWAPVFNEHALLDDGEMLAAVTAINERIHALAPVLNAPAATDSVQVASSSAAVPVATLFRRHGADTYLFAVGMREGSTRATFTVPGLGGRATVEVLDEERTLEATDGIFADDFAAWDVHLYRIH